MFPRMTRKEHIEARQKRLHLEELVDRACKHMHDEVDRVKFEMMRILNIAKEEHHQFAKPARYFKPNKEKK